jgi:hypothetical protein
MPRQFSTTTEQRMQRFCFEAVHRTLLLSSVSALAPGCIDEPARWPSTAPLLHTAQPSIVSSASYATFPCAVPPETPQQRALVDDNPTAYFAEVERRDGLERDLRARGLRLRADVDYIEIVHAAGPGSIREAGASLHAVEQPLARAGLLCRGAHDVPTCQSQVRAQREALFKGLSCVGEECPSFSFMFAVTTHADEVRTYRGRAPLARLFGAVDTPIEAWLLVSADGAANGSPLPLVCGTAEHGQHRAGTEGHFIKSRQYTSTCQPLVQEELEYLVTRAGGIKLVSRHNIVYEPDSCVVGGRRPAGLQVNVVDGSTSAGALLAQLAQLEAASVLAFERLADELRTLGADGALVARLLRASREERRHAAVMQAWAQRHGVTPAAVEVPQQPPRGALEIALENAEEGCVRELFGALVMRFQAERASDASLRADLARIADDEASHAALSHDLEHWLAAQLTEAERTRIAQTKRAALRTLAASLREPSAEQRHLCGLPSLMESRHLLAQLHSSI